MLEMDQIQKRILEEVADLHDVPIGAYNLRANGKSVGRNSTADIDIQSKADGSGLDITIKDGTKKQSVHIPVVISASGLTETVYNDFHVGENCDVLIIKYVEKHYGSGDGLGQRILNPQTEVYMEEGSSMEMEMVQIKGVDSTDRATTAKLAADAHLVVRERLMTHGVQKALSTYHVTLEGDGSSADIVSRGVARGSSYQRLDLKITGDAACSGHTECDSIIMDQGKILAVPSLEANSVDAMLVHEAAIGKIAGEQLTKLMTLGLTEAEAEEQIINGFLK